MHLLKLYAKNLQSIRGELLYQSLLEKGFILGKDLTETFPTGIFLSSLEVLLSPARDSLDVLMGLSSPHKPIELENIKTKKA